MSVSELFHSRTQVIRGDTIELKRFFLGVPSDLSTTNGVRVAAGAPVKGDVYPVVSGTWSIEPVCVLVEVVPHPIKHPGRISVVAIYEGFIARG